MFFHKPKIMFSTNRPKNDNVSIAGDRIDSLSSQALWDFNLDANV